MKLPLRLPSASALAMIISAMISASKADTLVTNPFSDAFVATGPTGNLSADNFGGGGALVLAAPNLPKGEFQTVVQFDLSGISSALNTKYGIGQWTIQSAMLQLTATPHANTIYNSVAAGQFNVSLMQNNSWVEGTGTAGAPTMDGISYNSLQAVYINNATDQSLGTFTFPGGTSGATTSQLTLTSGLVSDLESGSDVSLRLFAADNMVSYLFSSRSDSILGNRPELIINAIPEPGSLTLCGMGLAMLLFWRSGLWHARTNCP